MRRGSKDSRGEAHLARKQTPNPKGWKFEDNKDVGTNSLSKPKMPEGKP